MLQGLVGVHLSCWLGNRLLLAHHWEGLPLQRRLPGSGLAVCVQLLMEGIHAAGTGCPGVTSGDRLLRFVTSGPQSRRGSPRCEAGARRHPVRGLAYARGHLVVPVSRTLRVVVVDKPLWEPLRHSRREGVNDLQGDSDCALNRLKGTGGTDIINPVLHVLYALLGHPVRCLWM
jgi:hypothetical protein